MPRNDAEHREVWLLIPWLVNDRIESRQRERVDAHLRECALCRGELQQQRAVQAAMTGDFGIEHMPGASLSRLRQRLDAEPIKSRGDPLQVTPTRHRITWHRSLWAASISIATIAAAIAVVSSRYGESSSSLPDSYFTVTSNPARPAREAIRAVFKPTLTLAQLQDMLDESHLQIIAGPSEAGVYSLTMTRQQPVTDALARLRRSPDVRFAEATVPIPAREDQ